MALGPHPLAPCGGGKLDLADSKMGAFPPRYLLWPPSSHPDDTATPLHRMASLSPAWGENNSQLGCGCCLFFSFLPYLSNYSLVIVWRRRGQALRTKGGMNPPLLFSTLVRSPSLHGAVMIKIRGQSPGIPPTLSNSHGRSDHPVGTCSSGASLCASQLGAGAPGTGSRAWGCGCGSRPRLAQPCQLRSGFLNGVPPHPSNVESLGVKRGQGWGGEATSF